MILNIVHIKHLHISRTLLFLILAVLSEMTFARTYGLKFQSHDKVLDKRTELDLSPDQFFSFHNEFELNFDYKIELKNPNDYSQLFGYIFRIISKENTNVDLLMSPSPATFLNLVTGESDSVIQVGSPILTDKWINLRIKFLLDENRLIFYTPDTFLVRDNIGFKRDDSFKIIFGACNYENFRTSDVPSISIKDIRILEDGNLKHHWPLNETEGNIAKNRHSSKDAFVNNPSWLKNNHQAWQAHYQNRIEGLLLVTSDDENGKIFLLTNDELIIYSAQEDNIQSIPYRDKPVLNTEYKAIYNSIDGKIYCYILDDNFLYSLDISTGSWDVKKLSIHSETRARHHNSYFNPVDSSIYIFGGYGQHKYNNEIRKINLNGGEYKVLPSDKNIFTPRYLAGLGILNDTLYILGGYGSLSGSQMVNPHSNFDLFGYSLKDKSLFKKFEIPRLVDDMCVANTMWIDRNTRDYYALLFEKNKFNGILQMIKGSIDHPETEFVANSIPFSFQDAKSNAGLFYFPAKNKFFAYTSFAKDSASTQVEIYSLDFPPNQSDINPFADQETRKNITSIYFILILAALAGFSLLYYFRRKIIPTKPSPDSRNFAVKPEQNDEALIHGLQEEENKYQLVLFGGFQVYNLNNEDITNKFSPLLKELFLLVFLHTHKNNKGISSEKLTEYLWFDKEEVSARNNRAVNFAKLKLILAEIGNLELTKKTGYWKIMYESNQIRCDYTEFLQAFTKTSLTREDIIRIVEITQKGPFLLNVNYEWLDDFKSDVSDKIVDILVNFAEKCDLKADARFIVQLADCIFNFDRINEEAMILKCKAEHCLGKHSLAKLTYEKFVAEYKILYNEEYHWSFHQLIKSKGHVLTKIKS